MSHLTDEQLLDAAEGTVPETAVAHLRGCDRCQRELVGLQAALAEAAAVEVPEPSPLFWDHLSRRVREATATMPIEGANRRWWSTWRMLVPVGVAAGVILAVIVSSSMRPGPAPETGADLVTTIPDLPALLDADIAVDDQAVDLMSVLAADLDWDAAAEVGLPVRAGTIDRLVFELNDEEREELRRLLREELGANGA